MAAHAQIKPDFDGSENRQLADDIARAINYRPLMSRLGRAQPGPNGTDSAAMAVRFAPVAEQVERAEEPSSFALEDARSLEEIIDDLACPPTAPPSAAWLEKAHEEQREQRKRNAIAWMTTFAIASAIVLPALVLLRA